MPSENKSDLVSVLICSRDRRKDLETLVCRIKKIDTSYSFEIVVVEETNDPITIEGTRYTPHPVANRGFPYARNLALENASGEIIIFVDDDCHIQAGWLDNLLEPFRDDSVVGVQGGVTVPSGTNAIGWAESLLGFPGGGISRVVLAKGEIKETREISTLNCAYRKWVLDKVGGFDERLKFGGEDYLLAKKACNLDKCVFAPNASVSHAARGNLSKILLWFYRRGRAEVGVLRTGKQKDTTPWTMFKGSVTVKLLLLLTCIVILDWPIAFIVLIFAAYMSFQYYRYFRPWRLSGALFMALITLPLVKVAMDVGMDLGRFRGIILD